MSTPPSPTTSNRDKKGRSRSALRQQTETLSGAVGKVFIMQMHVLYRCILCAFSLVACVYNLCSVLVHMCSGTTASNNS